MWSFRPPAPRTTHKFFLSLFPLFILLLGPRYSQAFQNANVPPSAFPKFTRRAHTTPHNNNQHHVSSRTTATSATTSLSELPTPPSKQGFLRRIRDLVAYLKNPDEFIERRSQELGPIFQMYMFLKPTVIVGGQENVKTFIREREAEAEVIYPSLPDSFLHLHTKWGALNLDANDILFKQARGLFKDVLASPEALSYYTKKIEPAIENYVDELVRRVEENSTQEFMLVPEVLELCLQVFSELFSGKGLSKEQVQMFIDYNNALFALSEISPTFKKGKLALDTLKKEMLERFKALNDPSIGMDTSGKFYHSKVAGREGFEDEDRIGTGIVLFVWGAYVECASLMLAALALSHQKDLQTDSQENLICQNVVKEFNRAKESGLSQSDFKFWTTQMPYTIGVLREALRVQPPGAGVPRSGTKDFELGGYRIPASVPVMLEPRIGNKDPNLYAEPNRFEPLRWVPADNEAFSEDASKCPFAGSALKLGTGSFFPGGNGAHKCPGVPLAEIVSAIFLAKMSERLTWKFSGSGLTEDGEIDFVRIPVKILPDNFGFYFAPVRR